MVMNIDIVIDQWIILPVFVIKMIGRIITISISKIRNRTAIKKNWIEKGMRDDLLGSNPHSNGDIFSRSRIDFFEIVVHTNIRIIEIEIAIIADIRIFIITFLKL